MKTKQRVEKTIMQILNKNLQLDMSHPVKGKRIVVNEIIALFDEKKLDPEQIEDYPVFDKNYLNECIEKAKPNLSKIKDVDKTLDEIRGVKSKTKSAENYLREKRILKKGFREWIVKFSDGKEFDIVKLLQEYASQFDQKETIYCSNTPIGSTTDFKIEQKEIPVNYDALMTHNKETIARWYLDLVSKSEKEVILPNNEEIEKINNP